MANTRLSMRKIKDVLRLTHDTHLNTRQVALSLNISRSTVTNYQERAQKAGLSWPLPEDLTEEALEQRLFPPPVCCRSTSQSAAGFRLHLPRAQSPQEVQSHPRSALARVSGTTS